MNKTKLGIIILAAVTVITTAVIYAFVLVGGEAVRTRWVASNLQEIRVSDSWGHTASRINGNTIRSIDFSAEGLANLHARSSTDEGSISLTLSQGDIEKTLDFSSSFYGNIDTNAFEPGRIRLELRFDDARDVNLLITWVD
jgi:hypothetical protein